jgi:hypothetical protein
LLIRLFVHTQIGVEHRTHTRTHALILSPSPFIPLRFLHSLISTVGGSNRRRPFVAEHYYIFILLIAVSLFYMRMRLPPLPLFPEGIDFIRL